MTWRLKGAPFSVQVKARQLAEGRNKYLWLMEQGLGKTAVALDDYLEAREKGLVDGLAVVCPNSLKTNWQDEAASWGSGIDFTLWPFKGDPRKVVKEAVAINYEALTNAKSDPKEGGQALLDLFANRRMYLVFDEVHRIKNPQSNVGKFVLGHLMKGATIRRGMTGTPYGNTIIDLYPILRLAGELEGKNPFQFRNRYAQMGGFMGKQVVGINPDHQEELFALVDGCGFRALKKEWTDIPDKLYRTQRIPMSDAVARAYKEMQEDFMLLLNDQAVTAPMIITQMMKLQQISSGFIRDEQGVDHHLVEHSALPKFKGLMDVLDGNGTTSKTLVFAHFSHTVKALMRCLTQELGTTPAYIIGGMKDQEIRDQKALFNQNGGPSVMVLQSQAGKEGHTLLGGEDIPCHTSVFYESTFDMIVRSQCEDRSHRFGQKSNVLIHDFVSSPIEAYVIKALQSKQDVATAVLDARRLNSL